MRYLPTGIVALAAAVLGACPGDNGSTDTCSDEGCPGSDAIANCKEIGPSQPVSSACCPEWGPDACGASLFCAAFDGRTIPTCYMEHSRASQDECFDDLHCISSSCNTDVGKCRSLVGEACDADIGCAQNSTGQIYVCDGQRCLPGGSDIGDLCNTDSECAQHHCIKNRCSKLYSGGPCTSADECLGNHCIGGKCTSGNHGEACNTDGDCVYMNCVFSKCSDGRLDAPCRTKDDCQTGGACIQNLCQSGQLASPCDGDDTCRSPFYCAKGTCQDGAFGDPCINRCECGDSDGTGASLTCVDGTCVAGKANWTSCTRDEDCIFWTTECRYTQHDICDPTKKKCVSAKGSSCKTDSQCQSGDCWYGECT
jgi:hypothetical protein